MIKALSGEVWKPLQFPGWKQLRNKYALSSNGRIASYKDDVLQDGKLLQGSITTGYKTLNLQFTQSPPIPLHLKPMSFPSFLHLKHNRIIGRHINLTLRHHNPPHMIYLPIRFSRLKGLETIQQFCGMDLSIEG